MSAKCVNATGKNKVWAVNRDCHVSRGPTEGKFPGVGKKDLECLDSTEDDALWADNNQEVSVFSEQGRF